MVDRARSPVHQEVSGEISRRVPGVNSGGRVVCSYIEFRMNAELDIQIGGRNSSEDSESSVRSRPASGSDQVHFGLRVKLLQDGSNLVGVEAPKVPRLAHFTQNVLGMAAR